MRMAVLGDEVSGPLSSDAFKWDKVVQNIEQLALQRCYERLNKIVSLGLVDSLRRKAAGMVLKRGVILDVGCGPGTSSIAIRMQDKESKILMLDPSINMLYIAKATVNGLAIPVQGIFERLPFKDSSIDSIVAMFSFRDSIDYEAALDEFKRVLKDDGRLIILDLFRPSNSIVKSLAKFYLFLMSYLGSILTLCLKSGGHYSMITKTLDRMYTVDGLKEVLSRKFKNVIVHKGPIIVHIVVAEGPLR